MADDERDYLLGTHDEEIARLGLQHRVWRPRVLAAWRRAGVTTGMTVADAGAGWATVDLAEIVGSAGRVHALEPSQRFLQALNGTARVRGLSQITAHAVDLAANPLPVDGLDAVWVRWVLAFIREPGVVVAKPASALKPAGVMVVQE